MRKFFNVVSDLFNSDPNAVNPDGFTRLECAVNANDMDKVKGLIKAGADVNLRGGMAFPPLHFALRKDRQHIALAIINAGARLDMTDLHGQTPLHHSVELRQDGLTVIFLKKGADTNIKDKEGRTPLHMLPHDKPDLVDCLIAAGALANEQDKDGNTPLHRLLDKPEMVERLLAGGADPNIANSKGVSPYMAMVNEGRLQAYPEKLQKMVALRTEVGTSAMIGESILRFAVRLEKEEPSLEALKKTDLTATDANGNNVLHALVRTQNTVMISRVLECAPELAGTVNKEGLSPLAELMRRADSPVSGGNYIAIAQLLVGAKASLESLDGHGRSILHHAVAHGSEDFLEDVLLKGVKPNLADKGGKTALHYAIERGNVRAMDILLDNGADPDMTDKRGWTILDRLAEKGDRDSPMVQRLIVASGQYKKQLPLHPEMMHRHKTLDKCRPLGNKPKF